MKCGELVKYIQEHELEDFEFLVNAVECVGSGWGFEYHRLNDVEIADIGYSSKVLIVSGELKK